MPVLLDSQGQAQELPQDHAEAALAAGTHQVPLVSPEGDPVAASLHERDQLLQQGYKLPSQQQLQSLVDASRYGTTGQTVLAGVEGAAETASLGTAGALEAEAGKALGVKGLEPEAQLKRAEQNPVAHPVGEAAGLVIPSLLGEEAGAVGALGKVGELGEAAAKALVGGAPERLAARLAGWAGRGASEGALLTSEHVLNEGLLGDPHATAEHAVAEVGLGALFGGAGGAILGKTAEGAGNLASRLLGRGEEGGLMSNLTKLKPNAGEITAAADRLGVEPLPGQLSASRTVQDLQSQIAKEPTIVGRKEQAAVDRQFDAIRGATSSALGEASPMTKAEVGDSLRQGITQKLEETYKPISDAYDYLKTTLQEIPLAEKSLIGTTRAIRGIEGVRIAPSSPEYKLAEAAAEEVRRLANVTELRQYASSVSRQAAGNPSLKYVSGAIRGIISDLEESSIAAAAEQLVKSGKLSPGELELLNSARASSKAEYKSLMGQMGELGDVLGKRKVYGPKDFLDHLSDVPAERLADRLFQKNNSKFLSFLSENFPEQAQALAKYQKSAIVEKATRDGLVQPGQALREIDKLEPEVQKFLFSKEDLAKLSDAQTMLEAMPKDVNPSGSAKSISWGDALNPMKHVPEMLAGGVGGGPLGAAAGLVAGIAGPEVSSMLKRSILKGLVSGTAEEVARHEALGQIMSLSQSAAKSVASAAKAIFSKAPAERLALSRDERDRLSDKVQKLADDPEELMKRVDRMTAGMSEHAPEVATATSATASRAVQYLAQLAPRAEKLSPFGPKVEPSEFQKAAFKRAAEVVLDPLSVMHRVIDGTVSMPDVKALQTVYPSLYTSMREQATSAMADAVRKGTTVPYSTRLGLSVFLGTSVDPSISGASIRAAQGTFAMSAAKPQPGEGSQQPPTKHSTAALSKAGLADRTPEQAAAARRAKV